MNNESELIFYNNNYIPVDSACIYANDRGFTLGDGIFETMLSHNLTIPFYNQHINRLTKSADILNIDLLKYYNKNYIYSKIIELIKHNQAIYNNINDNNDWLGIKIILTRGRGPRSVEYLQNYNYHPNLIISSFTINKPTLDLENNYNLSISPYKINQHSPLYQIKSLNYLDKILSKQNAIKNNFNDCLLINLDNNITEATTSNIFFILDNYTIITPQISDGILPGITRAFFINKIKNLNINLIEQSININNLNKFKSAFICNSIMGIKKITLTSNNHQYYNNHYGDNIVKELYSKFITSF